MPINSNPKQIGVNKLSSFLACLGIGTLYAIRAGALSPEVGIWSLGAPKVWEPLLEDKTVSQELIEILQTCDELSAIQKLMPEAFNQELTLLIERLEIELKKMEDSTWQMEWISSSN